LDEFQGFYRKRPVSKFNISSPANDIRPQLAARISSKDKLVPTYRANLPVGARVWLLHYTGVTVARSMMIPHGIEEWKFSFRFDRVFWFTALEGQFAEIQRAEAANMVGS
jgi:hypothetical protein